MMVVGQINIFKNLHCKYNMKTINKKSLLLALSIGDGSIAKSGKDSYYLELNHSIKQLEYLKYKCSLIEKVFGTSPEIKISYADREKVFKRCRIRFYHPYLKFIYRDLYVNGKKVVNEQQINKVDALGFSLLFMDDGSRTILKNKDGDQRSVNIYISLMYDLRSTYILIRWIFDKFGVQFRVGKVSKKDYYRLVCGTIEGRKLQAVLSAYLIPSLEYKLCFN